VDRPVDQRIDDLTDPVFPEEIEAAFEMVAAAAEAITFSLDALKERTAEETGLDDFGDDLADHSLEVFLHALDQEGELSSLGRYSAWESASKSMRTRLLVTDLLKRHPEIHDIEIRRPIVIAGHARTGTTHMHNLMSADPTLRSLPYWESLEPVPPASEQGQRWDRVEDDPRYQRCTESLSGLNATLPMFKRMHDMYPEHVHEEIQLLAVAGSTMLFETSAVIPTWRDHYLATDQTPFYEYMKTMLKVLTFADLEAGGDVRRWLLKSPQHVEQYGPLMTVFPDATVVRTHRDPVAISTSMATMNTYVGRMSRQPDKVGDIGRYWIERLETMMRAAVDQRDLVPSEQCLDVAFHEFMADDIATIRRIYDLADQPFTGETDAAMTQFMADHPRGKHGRVLYDLSQFGVDSRERRQALQFYVDAFDITIEDGLS